MAGPDIDRNPMQTSVPKVKVNSDLNFSRLIYGTWRLTDPHVDPSTYTPEALLDRIQACLSLGITTFDLADIYGGGGHECEKCFGAALKLKPELRENMQLVTKCDIRFPNPSAPNVKVKHYDTSKKYLISQVEDSLKCVGVEYFDALLIHRPDPLMDADEVAQAMNQLKQQAKVRYFGVSNFTPSQFDLLQSRLEFPLITNQIEMSVLHVDPLFDGSLDQCQKLRISPMIWSPLAGGSIFTAQDTVSTRTRKAMQEVAQELKASIDQVAFAWLLRHPAKVLPIIGTNDPNRLKSAAASFKLDMSRQQWFKILEAFKGHECA